MIKKYEHYKDSGVAWLGEIPEHWEIKKIKFVANVYNGDSLNENLKKSFESFDKNHIPYISSKDIDVNNSNINYDNGIRIPKENNSLKVAPSFSSLLCIEGGSAGRKIAFTNQEVCFVNKLACFSIKTGNESEYLYYSLKGSPFQTQFKFSLSGMIGGVSISSINNFTIPIPPLQEQTAIAQFLDDKTTKIDQAIAIKQQQIALLKERKQILIHKAVTRGLNDKVALKDSGVECLPAGKAGIGEIPEHWEVKRLKNFITNLESGVSVNASEAENASENEIGVLKTSCVYNYKFEFEQNKKVESRDLKRVACPVIKHRIIISRMNAPELVGASGLVRESYPNLFLPDRLWQTVFNKSEEIDVFWLSQVLITKAFRDCITSIASGSSPSMKNITKGDFLNLRLAHPPLSEQKEIANYIETTSSKIETAISIKEQEIEKLQEYKSSLINSVVTGKVKVC